MSQYAEPAAGLPLFADPAPPPPAQPRRFGEAKPPAWTPEQIAVHTELKRHRGAASAIKAEDLAEAVCMDSTRRLQRVIHELINTHGVAVGSSMRDPFGYYLAVSTEEKREAGRFLIRRCARIGRTARSIMDAADEEVVRMFQTELQDEAPAPHPQS